MANNSGVTGCRRSTAGHRPGIIASWLTLIFVSLSVQPAAAETKSFVMSWFVPAMYAHEGDCLALDPVPDPGRSPVDSMYRRMLLQLGMTPEEADKILMRLGDGDFSVTEIFVNRGRVNGQPVNAFQNPETTPDPQLHTVVGKYAIGFNLDGKGAGSPGSFEDPYTHEQGIDNQFYRASGCSKAARVVSPEKSSHWEDVWHYNIDRAPAILISVTGADLSRDGDVTIIFDRTIERTRNDALSNVRRDMTFRADPSPLARSVLRGKIKDGVITVQSEHLKFGGKFATVPFDLSNTRLRFQIKPDGSLEGLLAGYQSWRTIYHFYYAYWFGTEMAFGINIPGMYHALKKLADADPDPVTGQNERISITYALKAVPAFMASHADEQPLAAAVVEGHDKTVPLATPVGITIQAPTGMLLGEYRPLTVDAQYYADARGMALYTFEKDEPNKSSCDKDCEQIWPPLTAEKGAKAFGEWSLVRRKGGRKQWAFRGKPLYTYVKDTVIGEPTGAPAPTGPYEERQEVSSNDKSDTTKPPLPLWQLATYRPAQRVTPNGIAIGEVVDVNGEVLVDVNGKTLYAFHGDPKSDGSSCLSAECTGPWIPLAAAQLANSIDDFTLVRRQDGIRQWVYKGKALYRFRGDLESGHAKGVGVDKRWQAALVRQFYMPQQVRIRESVGRGKVLTDENGMTLYRRSATRSYGLARSVLVRLEEGRIIGARSCDAKCMTTWIPFEAPANARPAGFWDVLTLENGKKQWSYKSYALYRYAGDKKPGDVTGSYIYDLQSNPYFQAKSDAAAQVASAIKAWVDVPLIWSHVYP